jgi:hypothetical protein
MPTVTSQDGTKIAFDKVGSGPAVIPVNGAIAYRALDPTLAHLAERLGQLGCLRRSLGSSRIWRLALTWFGKSAG